MVDSGTPNGDSAASADAPASTGDGGGAKYDQNGPLAYTTSTATVQNGADSFTENIYLPSFAGARPVVSISPGLEQPSAAYVPYAERLATYGVIVLMRDDPGVGTTSQTVVSDLAYVLTTWLPAQNVDTSSALRGAVDISRVGLAGHSRGGQATLLAAEGPLMGKVVGWFGIDAIDSGSVDGIVESTMAALTTLGTIDIPTTFLGAQVVTSCSPADLGYQVLYPAAPSPSVLITAVNASHTEFEVQASCELCGLCTPMGSANPQVVLAYSVRYLTAFFARELLHDTSVGAAFQGAGAAADEAAGLVQVTSK
jgi:Chlorophyllase enzyme